MLYVQYIGHALGEATLTGKNLKSHSALIEKFNEAVEKRKNIFKIYSEQFIDQADLHEDFPLDQEKLLEGLSSPQGIILLEWQRSRFLLNSLNIFFEDKEKPDDTHADEEESLDGIIQNYRIDLEELLENETIDRIYKESHEISKQLHKEQEEIITGHIGRVSCFLKLDSRNSLIRFLNTKFSEIDIKAKAKEKLITLTEILSQVKDFLRVLGYYGKMIEEEEHPILKDRQSKYLIKFRFDSYPIITQFLLKYCKFFREIGCDQLALEAIVYASALLEPLKIDDKEGILSSIKKDELKNLFSDLERTLKHVKMLKNKQFFDEARKEYGIHSLDLVYGKRSYLVRFPNLRIIESLWNVKQEKDVKDYKNLSAHYMTIVYRQPNAEDKTKGAKKTLHFPCNPPRDFFTLDNFNKQPALKEFLCRKNNGLKVYQENSENNNLFPLVDKAELAEFTSEEIKLSHSEQTFFKFLNEKKSLIDLLKKHDKNFVIGCKIYLVAFDIGSTFDSCINCRMSALSFQSGSTDGLPKKVSRFSFR
ncbi:MAG: hypothetical protein H0U27_00150 [Nitrosopumilus sp.]|nr:hypothetical protein [Nitrosopumilus sp.]